MQNFPKKPAKLICFSCGFEGHERKDPKCPAKGKPCRKCKQYNHFQKMCKSNSFNGRKTTKEMMCETNRKESENGD